MQSLNLSFPIEGQFGAQACRSEVYTVRLMSPQEGSQAWLSQYDGL